MNDFGGHQRLNDGHGKWIRVDDKGWSNRRHSLKLYIPSRCAIVLAPFEFAVKYNQIKLPHYDPEDPAFKQYIPSNQLAAQKPQAPLVEPKEDIPLEQPKAQEDPKPEEEKLVVEKPIEKPKPEKKKLIDLMEDLTLA